MARLLRMPEVAANATEAVLAEWLVGENASFSARDAIATVETEKAVVDVEAESDGVVLKTLVTPGTQVEVGAPIAVVAAPGEQVVELEAVLAELGVSGGSSAAMSVGRSEERGEPAPPQAADPEGGTAHTHPSAPSPETPSRRGGGAASDSTTPEAELSGNGHRRVFASPLARRMARDAGLVIEDIAGTGPRSRILRRDVERTVAEHSGGTATASVVGRAVDAVPDGAPYTEIPHSRLRRATAARLVESKQTAPHFYVRATLRVDRLLDLRAELNEGADTPFSVNDLVVKAAAAAHRRVPEMNVVWTPEAVRAHERVDLAVAVATERGLLTPVVRDVASLSVTTLAATLRDLVDRARAGRLKQEELEGGTMCVTNLGIFGTEEFAAIINPPQASILAVGVAREEPVVEGGVLAVGKVMRVTLSVDHRPVDGVVAARWMSAFTDLVEHPGRILA